MSTRRRILVILEGRYMTVRGWGSRDLLVDLCRRAPQYDKSRRGWHAQAHRLPDLIALAESLGYAVVVEGDLPAPVAAPVVPASEPAAGAARQDAEGLW